MRTVEIVLLSLAERLAGKLVKIYTDTQNVTRIVSKGSMCGSLQTITFNIYEAEWVPRELSVKADSHSKMFYYDDWSVSDSVLTNKWGPCMCDRFADCHNTKLETFYSKYWVPCTKGVDAFAFDWTEDMSWLVPPPSLIAMVLFHCRMCAAVGILIIPKWTSAIFWPVIWNDRGHRFQSFVQYHLECVKPSNLFEAGSDKDSMFAKERFESNVLALIIHFS